MSDYTDRRLFGDDYLEARNSDPNTSRDAALSLDHGLKDVHRAALRWFERNGPQTDDEAANGLVMSGFTDRHETARRWVRTVRERHGLLVPALDEDGLQMKRKNARSGREALCWTVPPPQ